MTRVMETDSETKERLKVFNSKKKKKKMFVDEFSSIGHSGLGGLAGDP